MKLSHWPVISGGEWSGGTFTSFFFFNECLSSLCVLISFGCWFSDIVT